jgi:hypothetical protein
MHAPVLASFLETSRTVVSMCSAGIAVFIVALWTAKRDIARASGLEKIVALTNLCLAVPLAVFGTLHLSGVELVLPLVPPYMPGRLFWAYLVGVALLAASLSIATKIEVRWSGLLFGIMMFSFVAMIHFPGALEARRDRFLWTIVFREMSFASAGWILAASAMSWQGKDKLIAAARVLIAMAAIFFAIEAFLHPTGVPVIPLRKMMPEWIPARALIAYLSATIVLAGGLAILLGRKTRVAATYLGTWILLLVVFFYGPILVMSLSDPSTAVKIEGINYFADTLLFGGAILAIASAAPARP